MAQRPRRCSNVTHYRFTTTLMPIAVLIRIVIIVTVFIMIVETVTAATVAVHLLRRWQKNPFVVGRWRRDLLRGPCNACQWLLVTKPATTTMWNQKNTKFMWHNSCCCCCCCSATIITGSGSFIKQTISRSLCRLIIEGISAGTSVGPVLCTVHAA